MTEATPDTPDTSDGPGTPVSSVTEEDRKFVEQWENVGPGTTGIIRLDARGDTRHEMIRGPRTFMITTEERMISQDRVMVKELDPFLNGTFRPVVVPDTVTILTNPNALSDEEISKILKSSDLAWGEWMQNIDSVATLHRMMDLAEGNDVSLKRYRELEARLIEVRPMQKIDTNDPDLQDFLTPQRRKGGAPGRRTAASGVGNPRREQGGMSSDYR